MDALMRHDVLANPHVSEREIFRMLDRIQRRTKSAGLVTLSVSSRRTAST